MIEILHVLFNPNCSTIIGDTGMAPFYACVVTLTLVLVNVISFKISLSKMVVWRRDDRH